MPDIFWGEKKSQLHLSDSYAWNFVSKTMVTSHHLPPSHPSHYPSLIPPKILCPPLLEHDC